MLARVCGTGARRGTWECKELIEKEITGPKLQLRMVGYSRRMDGQNSKVSPTTPSSTRFWLLTSRGFALDKDGAA